jgi:acetyltransferase-like isoleucine patch superfamily enzyme
MNLRHFAATSDHWVARTARTLRRGAMNIHVPAPKLIVRPLLWVFLAIRSTYYFLARVFVCEPLFKAYCTSYGRNLRTGVFMQWVQGKGTLIIGDDVTLYGKCSFNFGARFSRNPTLMIGDRTAIGHSVAFTVADRITVGNDVKIASGAHIFDAAGHPVEPEARRANMPTPHDKVRPIVIEDNVWIGTAATICPGVTIGEGSVVATKSVVTKSVPPLTLVAGNPAVIVRTFQRQKTKAAGRASDGSRRPTAVESRSSSFRIRCR